VRRNRLGRRKRAETTVVFVERAVRFIGVVFIVVVLIAMTDLLVSF
jgi:hypothetical protein